MVQWEVTGGTGTGGILVREGQGLQSPATADRLSTGAVVEQVQLVGDRLQFKRISGTGPAEGWVSIKISGKDLLKKLEEGAAPAAEASEGPAATAATATSGTPNGAVAIDAALKIKIEEAAKAKQKDGALLLYVMKYKVLGFPLDKPKLRILCFHNAGSAESCFTGPATPFITWIKESKQIELLAFDYPGRDKLLKATKHTSTDTLAPDLLAVAHEKLTDGVPYLVWGHSVGTWVAFEFLILARKIGLPMPKASFLNAFPAPQLEEAKRPWRVNAKLNEAQMKEEIMNWDKEHFSGTGKIVFDEPAWKETWEPLMRADFSLFDEYKFRHAEEPKFDFPIHSWHFDGEYYNKAEMIQQWRDWTTADFDYGVMEGMGHLTCIYKPDNKKIYYQKVTDLMKTYSGL